MKKFIKKVLLALLSLITLFISVGITPRSAFAQNVNYNWFSQPYPEWYLKVYDSTNPQELFGERYTAAQVQWVLYSIPSVLVNMIFGQNTKLVSCNILAIQGKTADVKTCLLAVDDILDGLISDITKGSDLAENNESIIQLVFKDRPLSGITYTKSILRSFHIIPQAQAADQGFGFGALGPLASIWRTTRNMAFALFTIVFIIFAFMIMFRVKLNPQTVITVQSALPKIVIAMILVTFSFAIAGFMVDLMYIVTALVATLIDISTAPTTWNSVKFFKFLIGEPTFIVTVKGALTLFLYFSLYSILFVFATIVASIAIATSLSANAMAAGFIGLLLMAFCLIFWIILFWNTCRIIWMLFQTTAQFYIAVILGPIQIALGTVIPGMGFGPWIKSLVSKLAVFPALGILFYYAFVFILNSYTMSVKIAFEDNIVLNTLEWAKSWLGGSGSTITHDVLTPGFAWNPPFMGNSSLPLILIFMSLGCIMIMPKVGKAIASFMAGKEFDFETAIGEPISMAMKPVKGLWESPGIREIRQREGERFWGTQIGRGEKYARGFAERFPTGSTLERGLTGIANSMNKVAKGISEKK